MNDKSRNIDGAAVNLPGGHVLDNVTWQALTGPQSHLAIGDQFARRFIPDVAPFGAMRDAGPVSMSSLRRLVRESGSLAIVTHMPPPPMSDLVSRSESLVDQMVLTNLEPFVGESSVEIDALSEVDVPEMMALAASTKPGPFGPRTIEMGSYYGIRMGGQLVGMAGERLKVAGHTEISAVCVAARCRGMGYAGALVKKLTASIVARGETPFLHVTAENTSARALYERLGFHVRRRLHLSLIGEVTVS